MQESVASHSDLEHLLDRTRRPTVLLLGVGGSGMRALAEYLFDRGCHLVGVDQSPLGLSEWAQRLAMPVEASWRALAVSQPSPDLIVHSAAVEVSQELRGIWPAPTISYPELLGELSRGRDVVSVAGTHGKSTTCALLATALGDVSRIAGGVNLRDRRSGRYVPDAPTVVEACEFRAHFRHQHPAALCLLNLEWDHPDCYSGIEATVDAFAEFVSQVRERGPVVIGEATLSHSGIRASVKEGSVISFGRCRIPRGFAGPHFWATDISRTQVGTSLRMMKGEADVGTFVVPTLPTHFVDNAIGAIALALELGTSARDVAERLTGFRGVDRRFAISQKGNAILIDDYAHHPTAIRDSLAEIRRCWPDRPVLVAFEPHQAGRLQAFETAFVEALSLADEVAVAPIFAAREKAPSRERQDHFVRSLRTPAFRAADLDQAAEWIETRLNVYPNAVLAVFGAGHIGQILDERRLQTTVP